MNCVVSFRNAFKEGALIPLRSHRFEFAVTLATFRPDDAFIDLTSNSIFRVIISSIEVRVSFWILFSTISTILSVSLSIFSLKHLSNVRTFSVFSSVFEMLQTLLTIKCRSTVLSLTITVCCPLLAASPMRASWLKSSNWLKSFLYCCFFPSWKHVCLNKSIALITLMNK